MQLLHMQLHENSLAQATEMPNELPCYEDVQKILDNYEYPEDIEWSLRHLKVEFPKSKDRGMSKVNWLDENIERITQPREEIIANRKKAMDDWLNFR